jgi:hypothetical protein
MWHFSIKTGRSILGILYKIVYALSLVIVVSSSILYYSGKDTISEVFEQFGDSPFYTIILVLFVIGLGETRLSRYVSANIKESLGSIFQLLFFTIVALVFNYIIHF